MNELFGLMEQTANMLRGMTMDPSIPAHAKAVMRERIAELEAAVEKHADEEMLGISAQNEKLRAALTDTLDFVERHSNRWDGISGKHPMEVVTVARELLTPNDGSNRPLREASSQNDAGSQRSGSLDC